MQHVIVFLIFSGVGEIVMFRELNTKSKKVTVCAGLKTDLSVCRKNPTVFIKVAEALTLLEQAATESPWR